jgi:hypothetical protein
MARDPASKTEVRHEGALQQQVGGGKDRKRVEKLVYIETKTVTTAAGTVEVQLLSQGGRIGLGELSETGEPVFVPLERGRTHRNADKRGTYRWYNDCRLPEHLGGGIITVRLHATEEDAKRKLDRAESRPRQAIRTSRCCTAGVMTQKASTVTLTTLCGYGEPTPLATAASCLNLITYALGVNALTMHLHRRGLAPPAAA